MKLLVPILISFCLSCSHSSSKQEDKYVNYFRHEFLNKFKTIELPLDISDQVGIGIHSKPFSRVNPESLDSLFVKYPLVCYGKLADTTDFYTLIFYPTNVQGPFPILSTYDKNGNRIFSQEISFGCWDGMGEYDCEGILKLIRN